MFKAEIYCNGKIKFRLGRFETRKEAEDSIVELIQKKMNLEYKPQPKNKNFSMDFYSYEFEEVEWIGRTERL